METKESAVIANNAIHLLDYSRRKLDQQIERNYPNMLLSAGETVPRCSVLFGLSRFQRDVEKPRRSTEMVRDLEHITYEKRF